MTNTISFDFVYGAETPYSEQDDWQRRSHGYTITLRYERRTARFDFCQRSTDKLRRLFGADFDEIVSREWED